MESCAHLTSWISFLEIKSSPQSPLPQQQGKREEWENRSLEPPKTVLLPTDPTSLPRVTGPRLRPSGAPFPIQLCKRGAGLPSAFCPDCDNTHSSENLAKAGGQGQNADFIRQMIPNSLIYVLDSPPPLQTTSHTVRETGSETESLEQTFF